MRTEADRAADNKRLDEVQECGHEFALGWLRGAYQTHQEQLASLLADFRELRALFLAAKAGPLTLREAQLCRVCRVCRGPYAGPFRLDFGKEYAHEACLLTAAVG